MTRLNSQLGRIMQDRILEIQDPLPNGMEIDGEPRKGYLRDTNLEVRKIFSSIKQRARQKEVGCKFDFPFLDWV